MSELERFKKYLKDTYPHPIDEYREAALWHLWQAALSTRKPYGWGVLNSEDGTPVSGLIFSKEGASQHVRIYKDEYNRDYRPVELFYEDSES